MDILIFWCFRMVQQKKLRVSGLCIRHTQTAPVSIRGCLEVSDVVCCRLLISWVPWSCLEGVWGISGGCLGISEWFSWKLEALRRVWGVSGIPVLTVWSRSIFLAQPWNPQLFSLDHSETSKYINVHICWTARSIAQIKVLFPSVQENFFGCFFLVQGA